MATGVLENHDDGKNTDGSTVSYVPTNRFLYLCRFINTDGRPYPEVTQNMHTHLHLFKIKKSSEHMEFCVQRTSQMVETLDLLGKMIQYPLYSSPQTVQNWKDIRLAWRDELLAKIDKSSFNKIIDLRSNFDPPKETDLSSIYLFEEISQNVSLGLTVWHHKDNPLFGRVFPKVSFPAIRADILMPAQYRVAPFVLRLIHVAADFFSDLSVSFDLPKSLPVEPDFLCEVQRWFEVKKYAKAAVADREREKVRAAKQKVLEAQAAAVEAERNFESFQQRTPKKVSSADAPTPIEAVPDQQQKVKKSGKDLIMKLEPPAENNKQRPRGIWDEGDRGNLAASLMMSEGAQKTLDNISMKSGMRKKVQERFKAETADASGGSITGRVNNIFYTPSMTSISQRQTKVEVRRASELCFEDTDDEISRAKSSSVASGKDSVFSFDSLDFMFGDEDTPGVTLMKTLVRNTPLVQRELKSRSGTKTSVDLRSTKGRKRGKSLISKKMTDEFDDVPQTASEMFEEREEFRQERYMSSLLTGMNEHHHVNLRAYQSVGGTFMLDLIFPESQPHAMPNGNSTQIFWGPLDIKRDPYEYKYHPPPQNLDLDPDSDPPPPDPELQNLFHVKVNLPKDVVFFEPPFVALWDKVANSWTRRNVHNFHTDFETRRASFYIEKPLPFAFFIKKYSLLPLIKWHMKPNFHNGGVVLSLMTQGVHFEFTVLDFTVGLTTVQGVPLEKSVDEIIGRYMHINELVSRMKTVGLNVFPDHDAFLYCPENTAKDPVLEDHVYMAMAMYSEDLEFHSSQWNNDFKRRKTCLQIREASKLNVELRYRTVTAGVDSAALYRCNDEDSGPLDETKMEKLGFNPDVYSLLQKGFSHAIHTSDVNPIQVVAVYDLLSRIKVLSYCGFNRKEANSSSSGSSKKSPRKHGKKSLKSRGKGAESVKQVPGSRSSQTSATYFNKPFEN